MRKSITMLLMLLITGVFFGQEQKKIFWSEDFSGGKLPDGWKVVSESDSTVLWECTDQPFPGSHQYNRQAPPIASKSRGYFMLYSPGVAVGKNINKWRDANVYPNGYFMTNAIDCSSLKSALLNFQQKFSYNSWGHTKDAGLYVGVSNDGKTWKDYNVINGVKPRTDSPSPMDVTVNVSEMVAGQKTVYIRFYWKGYFAWYWMVDDIELTEGYEHDLGVEKLISPAAEENVFGKKDVIVAQLKNFGSQAVNKDFDVLCVVNKEDTLKTSVTASEKAIEGNTAFNVSFPPYDLSTKASHNIEFIVNIPDDQDESNNKQTFIVYAKPEHIKEITATEQLKDGSVVFSSYDVKVKVNFLTDDIFRIQMAPLGNFEDPTNGEIVVENDFTPVKTTFEDAGDYYKVASAKCVVRAYKNPLRFALYDKDDKNMIWEEEESMEYGPSTIQRLKRQTDEYFYGGGMQNGYFSHRDSTIRIEIGGGWDNGGRPNPAPFYMSTAGYGAFRNTFSIGKYSFHDPLSLSHREFRFDSYYFYGPSLKKILDGYTKITGRPFMPPRWALEMGDANCYNKNGVTTPVVIDSIAKKYREHDMPGGWILPNDGYGCGYTDLPIVVKGLHEYGFYTGLWTENGVDKIAWEVGTAGSRLCKLDVAWVYKGYEFALNACKTAYEGIENNSDARGFVWSVMGWAGTQRYSTVWTGDQVSDWEYIRFHIPTVIGSGLSAQNAATGDIDGIFGGSPETYVRDLQWKCFTPVLMSMSGWAKYMKQPYIFGEPYTSYNRKYLKLKMRLTPYLYTYSHIAWETGVPTVRGMILEFPEDPVTRGNETQYQFMSGKWLLVAPIFRDEEKRDSIYLPEGTWIDYWDGTLYKGGQWLMGYEAPLEKLPLLVRSGAIIPMYPEMLYDGEKPKDPVTFDIYPDGNTSFEMYEDDGLTREYKNGAFAKTLIEVNTEGTGTKVIVNPAKGEYKGMPESRNYIVQIHQLNTPKKIYLNGKKLKASKSKEHYDSAEEGWYYDPADHNGIIYIKTKPIALKKGFSVEIK
jgi:alpha-glucosidase (family GH31 glycosyl hydrolase)